MYNTVIIRYGEIALKGENRSYFVNKLMANIQQKLSDTKNYKLQKTPGRIFIFTNDNPRAYLEDLKMLPGIVSISPALTCKPDFEVMKSKALKLFQKEVNDFPLTFRVETNRANKKFPLTSMEINREIGAHILKNVNNNQSPLAVDLENPDYTVYLDVRKNGVYIYSQVIAGPGGLPVGSSEKGLLLLSGGIDSPVAGWEAMTRGIDVEAVYFHSFPFTGNRAKEKVIDIAKILAGYSGSLKLYIGYFTSIQKAIQENCPQRYYITVMRRMMVRVACHLAEKNNNLALITGESLGQVASQTMESINVINAVSNLPILRPLITRDKQEIIDTARKVGTYNISIQPHEDCCTIMVPDHPVTRPKLSQTLEAENGLEIEELIKEAVNKTEVLQLQPE